jgi:ABC-type transporter MlaC component
LKNYVHSTVEHTANPEHKAFFDTSTAASVRMAATVFNQATPEQKAHFVKTLQQWTDDFNRLSA